MHIRLAVYDDDAERPDEPVGYLRMRIPENAVIRGYNGEVLSVRVLNEATPFQPTPRNDK